MTAVAHLTARERHVLAFVPPSDRPAFTNAGNVMSAAHREYGLAPHKARIVIRRLADAGLVEIEIGHVRRTPAGDEALKGEK